MLNISSISTPGAAAAAVLENTDPAELADLDLVAYAQAAERQVHHATAVSLEASRLLAERATARVAGNLATDDAASDLPAWRRNQMADRAGVDEVRQALRLSEPTTQHRLYRGRSIALDGPLAPAGRARAAGLISLVHVLVLLEKSCGLPDHIAAELQTRCLPRASVQTPGNFGKSLVRALHHLDPDSTAAAHRAARARAGVRTSPAEDGMGTLTVTATEPDTQWAYTVLDTLARAAQHRARAEVSESTVDEGTDTNGVPRTPPTTTAVTEKPRVEPDVGDGFHRTPQSGAEPDPNERDHDGALETPPQHPAPDAGDGFLRTPCKGDESDQAEPDADGFLRTPRGGEGPDRAESGRDGPLRTPPALPDSDRVLGTPPAEPGKGERLTLDQLRAQVFFDLLERAVHDPTFPTAHGKRRVETQVVITLDTLLGLRNDPATINGCSVPAPIAREMAVTALEKAASQGFRTTAVQQPQR